MRIFSRAFIILIVSFFIVSCSTLDSNLKVNVSDSGDFKHIKVFIPDIKTKVVDDLAEKPKYIRLKPEIAEVFKDSFTLVGNSSQADWVIFPNTLLSENYVFPDTDFGPKGLGPIWMGLGWMMVMSAVVDPLGAFATSSFEFGAIVGNLAIGFVTIPIIQNKKAELGLVAMRADDYRKILKNKNLTDKVEQFSYKEQVEWTQFELLIQVLLSNDRDKDLINKPAKALARTIKATMQEEYIFE